LVSLLVLVVGGWVDTINPIYGPRVKSGTLSVVSLTVL